MTDYKQLCAELHAALEKHDLSLADDQLLDRSAAALRAALAEPEPQRRCIYSPVQIAECGGPCRQGPEHCDCGELWVTEPEPEAPTQRQLLQLAAEFWPEGCEPTQATAYARAVLARWGNHPGSPDSSMQPQQSNQLMTKQLSPAAQAVFDSYKAASDGCYSGGEWLQNEAGQIAAALHEVAHQVVPDDLELLKRSGEAVRLNRLSICRQIHAIADELEAL